MGSGNLGLNTATSQSKMQWPSQWQISKIGPQTWRTGQHLAQVWYIVTEETTVTALHERQATGMDQLLRDGTHRMVEQSWSWKRKVGHMSQNMGFAQGGIGKHPGEPNANNRWIEHYPQAGSSGRLTCTCVTCTNLDWLLASLWLNATHGPYNINSALRAFIKNSMGMWRTILENNTEPIAKVTVKCGIYQGDALCPLLS